MSLIDLSANQVLLAIAVFGFAWVAFAMLAGGGSTEKPEGDNRFGLFDDFFKGFFKD